MPVAKEDRCCGLIYSDYHRYQCDRRGSTEHKGRKYCRTHNPELMHQKKLLRDDKWTEQRIAGQDAERIRIENHQVGAWVRQNAGTRTDIPCSFMDYLAMAKESK